MSNRRQTALLFGATVTGVMRHRMLSLHRPIVLFLALGITSCGDSEFEQLNMNSLPESERVMLSFMARGDEFYVRNADDAVNEAARINRVLSCERKDSCRIGVHLGDDAYSLEVANRLCNLRSGDLGHDVAFIVNDKTIMPTPECERLRFKSVEEILALDTTSLYTAPSGGG